MKHLFYTVWNETVEYTALGCYRLQRYEQVKETLDKITRDRTSDCSSMQ